MMLKGRFQPTFWATVWLIPALILLFTLGTWQMQRLQWKNAVISDIETKLAATAVPLPASIADIDAWAFRRVTVTGVFDHANEAHVSGRSWNGNAGYHVLTPLVRAQGDAVIVNRGWVPYDRREASYREEAQLSGVVMVEGMARVPDPRNWMHPDNDLDANIWFFTDLQQMGDRAGLPRVVPMVVDAIGNQHPGTYPVGGWTRFQIHNPHLSYALTWYALMIALLVIYVLYHWRQDDDIVPEAPNSPTEPKP